MQAVSFFVDGQANMMISLTIVVPCDSRAFSNRLGLLLSRKQIFSLLFDRYGPKDQRQARKRNYKCRCLVVVAAEWSGEINVNVSN